MVFLIKHFLAFVGQLIDLFFTGDRSRVGQRDYRYVLLDPILPPDQPGATFPTVQAARPINLLTLIRKHTDKS